MSDLVSLARFSPFSSLTLESKLTPKADVGKLIQHVLGIFGSQFSSLSSLGAWEDAGAAVCDLIDGSAKDHESAKDRSKLMTAVKSRFDNRDDFGRKHSYATCTFAPDGKSIVIVPASGSVKLSFSRVGELFRMGIDYGPTPAWTRADFVGPKDAATQQQLVKSLGIAVGDGVLHGPISIGGTPLALESLSLELARYDLVERDGEGKVVREFKLSDEVREFLRS